MKFKANSLFLTKIENRRNVRFLFLVVFLFLHFSLFGQTNDPNILIKSEQDLFGNENDIWINANLTQVDSIALEDQGIYYPHALTVNKNDQLAIMAWNDLNIYLFDLTDLTNVEEFSTRRGRGPGEYESPFDMFLTEGELWVSDIGLRKIDLWDIEQKNLSHTFSVENRFVKPDQVAFCNDVDGNYSLYVLSTQYGQGFKRKEGILHRYILDSGELSLKNTFQPLSENSERYPYVITGDIACIVEFGIPDEVGVSEELKRSLIRP